MRRHSLALLLVCASLVLCDTTSFHHAAAASAQRFCKAYTGNQERVCLQHLKTVEVNDMHAEKFEEANAVPLLVGRVGVGYNMATGQFGLPVVHMTAGPKTYHGTAIPSQVTFTNRGLAQADEARTYKKYEDYAKTLSWNIGSTTVDGETIVGGMMSHSQNMKTIYSKYFNGPISLAVSTRTATAYTLSTSSHDLDPYFETAVAALPSTYDANLYGLFLEYWGTHLTTSADFGGMLEHQTILRSCIWSKMAEGTLLNELKNELNGVAGESHRKSGNSYVSWRKMGTTDIIGGNPEIHAWRSRVSSFATDPVQIKYTVHRISHYITDSTKRAHVETAINAALHKAHNDRAAEMRAAEAAHAAWFKGAQSISAGVYQDLGHRVNRQLHPAKVYPLGHHPLRAGQERTWSMEVRETVCHTHHHLFHKHKSCHTETVPLKVLGTQAKVICERNSQGLVRARTSMAGVIARWPKHNNYVRGLEAVGPWVSEGCSNAAPFNPHFEGRKGIHDNDLGNFMNFYKYMREASPSYTYYPREEEVIALAAYASGICCIQRGLTTEHESNGYRFDDHCPAF
ncbi:MAC/Perforin domain [Carpediemonas membranifera]|uniref:MAC/Perforin domain n=1 Tax=Carpediemonas membranifera TaxID=201153 RepID=A0A8J6E1L4_9EUKA|nr:MAC/Perforin domain [Carpediemonas membranifera]|eukprot:KAG9393206.1 MAC/Perforin domain [Carpediemonas membranifera]